MLCAVYMCVYHFRTTYRCCVYYMYFSLQDNIYPQTTCIANQVGVSQRPTYEWFSVLYFDSLCNTPILTAIHRTIPHWDHFQPGQLLTRTTTCNSSGRCSPDSRGEKSEYSRLRARRALLQFKDVPLKTRRALLPYTVYGDSALLVLNGTSLICNNALLALNWRYSFNYMYMYTFFPKSQIKKFPLQMYM